MNEQISKIKNKLEVTGKYDLTLSRLLNEAILQNVSPEKMDAELKAHQVDYDHYRDLLDSLKIDDDILEVLTILFDKINTYDVIKTLINQLKNHNAVISTAKKFPYFNQILNAIHKNSGISITSLATILNVKSTLTPELNEAINLDLINLCVDEERGGEPHYFITARGITYINLLNKEDLK